MLVDLFGSYLVVLVVKGQIYQSAPYINIRCILLVFYYLCGECGFRYNLVTYEYISFH